ncbi:MAG: MFS domain-containing protein [Arenicellales bacterium IbO2]|nr:MFS transporter [Gammaproteobacteria bacterium]MDA7962409.1 MFS transporter [Gammaproteobacteria bacterium]CAJ2377660.1 MAG: MFS domain-containing protein [Arenicellales bacterium IbO2]
MLNDIRATWALLVGIGFMMLGNGLQISLLGLRATMEGFPTFVTGVMMSGYYIGMLIGSLVSPRLVGRVGHIRVFAALASTASISILLHGLYINAFSWTLMRIITGFCYAGLYVVTESWLNDRASNETRGELLSVYMVIIGLGLGAGQFLLNVADPLMQDLFILVSVVVSFGLIPMLLTARPAPAFELSGKLSLKELYRASPLAVIANILTGVAHGTVFALGAVYAVEKGFSTERLSVFMACFVFGGMLLQWPLGWLSDRIDRRVVMVGMSAATVALTLFALFFPAGGVPFLAVIALLGGMVMPMYSMCVAYANDRLEPEQIVAASGSLVLTGGVGLSLGPMVVSFLMAALGANWYFIGIGGSFLAILLFALYRMSKRAGVEVEDQMPALATGQIGTPVAETVAPDALEYVEAVSSGEVEQLEQLDEQAEEDAHKTEKRL